MIKALIVGSALMLGVQTSHAKTGETDPKSKAKTDSTQKEPVEMKGFKNLFASDIFNPAEPYQLQINPKAVPYIDEYIAKNKKHLEAMQIWGRPYFRMMDNILASYGLPKELKYLAVIESHLDNSTLSWAGARGPWQLMPETARQLGLVVNKYKDERTDYYKSTHAAAKYLKTLYNQLGGDWLLVIAGYNGGPGRVLSAIKRTGSRDFWELQYALPLESRNHVKKFIGTHYIMEGTGGLTTVTKDELASLHAQAVEANRVKLSGPEGITQMREALPETVTAGTTLLKIQGKYNSIVLANNLGMDINLFNQLNPAFDKMVSEEGGYEMMLPEAKMQQFNHQRYAILQQSIMALLSGVHSSSSLPEPKPAAPQGKGTIK